MACQATRCSLRSWHQRPMVLMNSPASFSIQIATQLVGVHSAPTDVVLVSTVRRGLRSPVRSQPQDRCCKEAKSKGARHVRHE